MVQPWLLVKVNSYITGCLLFRYRLIIKKYRNNLQNCRQQACRFAAIERKMLRRRVTVSDL